MNINAPREKAMELIAGQQLGVLATRGKKYPYTSLIGIAAPEEEDSLIFATMRNTRKFGNIERHPEISILINSSTNRPDDFKDAVSVTVLGRAAEVSDEVKERSEKFFLSKFPYLSDFVSDPGCVLVKVNIHRYIVVSRFQEVEEVIVDDRAQRRKKI